MCSNYNIRKNILLSYNYLIVFTVLAGQFTPLFITLNDIFFSELVKKQNKQDLCIAPYT